MAAVLSGQATASAGSSYCPAQPPFATYKNAFRRVPVPIGASVHREWQELGASSRCESDEKPPDKCRVHHIIKACERYCPFVDDEWYKIVDWYYPHTKPRRPIAGADLYDKLLSG